MTNLIAALKASADNHTIGTVAWVKSQWHLTMNHLDGPATIVAFKTLGKLRDHCKLNSIILLDR